MLKPCILCWMRCLDSRYNWSKYSLSNFLVLKPRHIFWMNIAALCNLSYYLFPPTDLFMVRIWVFSCFPMIPSTSLIKNESRMSSARDSRFSKFMTFLCFFLYFLMFSKDLCLPWDSSLTAEKEAVLKYCL